MLGPAGTVSQEVPVMHHVLDLSIPKELSNQFYCNTAVSNDVSNNDVSYYNALDADNCIIPFPV